jgi:hypothetical protein
MQDLREVWAARQPHRDEEVRWFVARGVDRDNMRMLNGNGMLDLALEAGTRPTIVDELGEQQLERDRALQRQILSLVDRSHSTLAQQPDKSKVPDLAADEGVAARHSVATR